MVVLLAQPLWLGWPSAAPPPPFLGVLRPIPFGVGVICDSFLFVVHVNNWYFMNFRFTVDSL